MSRILPPLLILVALSTSFAQEKVSIDDAQEGARLLTKSFTGEGQVKVELNLDEPDAIKAGEGGVLLVPDAKVSRKALANADAKGVPLGQLWMLELAPVVEGKLLGDDRMRLVKVQAEDKELQVQLYFLAVRKAGEKGLELLVYGKEAQPVLTLPLEMIETDQQLPVELQGRKRDEESGVLTLNILGRYKAGVVLRKHRP